MVEPLLHFAVPFASLRAVGIDWRMAVVAGVIALAPDLDVLFGLHRSLTHSMVVLVAVILTLIALTLILPENKGRGARLWVLVIAFGLAAHLVLDLFSTYTPILWPLLNQSYWIATTLRLHIGSEPVITESTTRIRVEPTVFRPLVSFDAPVLSPEGLAVSVILLAPSLVEILRNRWAGGSKPAGP